MSKVRVYELARELRMESKALVAKLKDLGIEVASHPSAISGPQITAIRRELSQDAEKGGPKVIRRRRKVDPTLRVGDSPGDDLQEGLPDGLSEASVADKLEDEIALNSVGEQVVDAGSSDQTVDASSDTASSGSKEVAAAHAPESSEGHVAVVSEAPIGRSEEKDRDGDNADPENSKIEAKPVEAKPVEAKPVEAKPVEAKPVEAKPVEAKPVEAKSVEAKSVEAKSVEAKPVEAKPVEAKPVEAKPVEAKPVEAGAGETQKPKAEAPPSKPKFTPAKIVRKAEVRSSTPPGRSPKPSDSRSGQRASSARPGPDSRDNRPPRAPAATSSEPVPVWSDEKNKRDKKKVPSPGSEKDDAAKRVQKVKRDHVNTRTLLSQLDGSEEEPAFVAKGRKKTVYTPASSGRRRDLKRRKDLKKTQITTPRAAYRVVRMGNEITIGELAHQLSAKAGDIIKKLMTQGVMATINQTVDFDTASIIASEYKFEVQSTLVSIDDILQDTHDARETADKTERPPIVTIMGHVDHGKTSILDAIRKANVATKEAGGITQHIGAYTVEKDGKTIAFLDTPGHEAFSSMRARGAKVTDIVILVVAADDGVMPQTVEAISHARDAKVPIIVAINKIDKPNTNFEKIYTELMEHEVQSEEWGGETQFVKVSAEKGLGLDDLLEAINLQAEILELSAPVHAPADGVVVEAHLDKGRGPVATVMIRQGTLDVGEQCVVGTVIGKVRAMHNHLGQRLKTVGPSTPVEIIGLSGVPMAGDRFSVVADEKKAKEVADWRMEKQTSAQIKTSENSMDELLGRMASQETPEVAVVVKADTQGSVEAIVDAVGKMNFDKVKNRVVHKAVGGVNESDVSLAAAANAIIIAFNVRASRGLDETAASSGVPIKYFSVIYDVVDAITNVMAGKLPPTIKEVVVGHAEVRQTIRVPKVGLVAGSSVMDGKITRNCNVRLIRDQVVIYDGRIGSLRRFKDDVKEVVQGYECGIGIDGYSDVRIGDVIETYVLEEHLPVLQ